MPELLTCRETPKSVAGRWPASNRNGGRIYFGMVADIKSERWPASRRNTWPTSIGIRNMTLKVKESPAVSKDSRI